VSSNKSGGIWGGGVCPGGVALGGGKLQKWGWEMAIKGEFLALLFWGIVHDSKYYACAGEDCEQSGLDSLGKRKMALIISFGVEVCFFVR